MPYRDASENVASTLQMSHDILSATLMPTVLNMRGPHGIKYGRKFLSEVPQVTYGKLYRALHEAWERSGKHHNHARFPSSAATHFIYSASCGAISKGWDGTPAKAYEYSRGALL